MAAKWDAYYAIGAPWDTGRPSSQLVTFLCSCHHQQLLPSAIEELVQQANQSPVKLSDNSQHTTKLHYCASCKAVKPSKGSSILEIGCGTGGAATWLAQQGFKVTAIDISTTALQEAVNAAAAANLPADNPRFIHHDILELSSLHETYDMIYDCQVYHVLVKHHPECQEKLPLLLYKQLNPGGVLFLLTGNANEPEIGPCVLTAAELLEPLVAAGFQVVLLHQTRFDSSEHYANVLKKRPLAWWAVLQKPATAA